MLEVHVQPTAPDEDADSDDPVILYGPVVCSGQIEISAAMATQLRTLLLAALAPMRERLVALGVTEEAAP